MPLLSTQAPTFGADERRVPHRNARARKEIVAAPTDLTADLARGRGDIDFFARRWLGLAKGGHAGQRRWWELAAARAEDGWRPRYLTTAVSSGNQAGKTLALAVLIAHHTFYKLGVAVDLRRWRSALYEWYHLGIQQETAELVYHELVRLFAGIHRAQAGGGCPLIDTFGPIVTWDRKYRGEYLWIVFHPYFGGGQIHFRTTQEKAKALLGKYMNGISFDEAAFELYLQEIYQEVLNLRRLATGGPLHFVSTPTEGHNDYYDIWASGDPANPARDQAVISHAMSTRGNIGFGLSADDFKAILRQQDPYLVPQNIDGQFIEGREAFFASASVESSFDKEMPEETQPEPEHRYVQAVDPGIAHDATAALTLDYTARPWRGVRAKRRAGHQQLPAIVNMVSEGHLLYSRAGQKSIAYCNTLVDSTGLGGKLFMQEFSIIRPLRSFDFAGTKSKKLQLLSDLKAILDRGDLRLPRGGLWEVVRRQLLGYKLADKNIEQDFVMALAMAVRHASRNPVSATGAVDFDYFGANA